MRSFRVAYMRRWPSALDAEAQPRRGASVTAMRRLAMAFALVVCAGLGAPRGAIAADDGDLELQVEAAFLVNFVRYTDWPPGRLGPAGAPYVVAVIGSADDASDIAAVAAAAGPIGGRRIDVRRVPPASLSLRDTVASELRASHVVFVRGNSGVRCLTVRRLLGDAPVLTVGDATGFAAAGGMLGLVRVQRHLAFEANPEAIRDARLLVSAKVLKLARIRRTAP